MIPWPLSAIWINLSPPSFRVNLIEVEPASSEFSISSLIAFEGRCMIYSSGHTLVVWWNGRTSAAAIWLTTSLLNLLIGLGPAGSYSTSIAVILSFIVFSRQSKVKSSQLTYPAWSSGEPIRHARKGTWARLYYVIPFPCRRDIVKYPVSRPFILLDIIQDACAGS